jgi:hypothetical protein
VFLPDAHTIIATPLRLIGEHGDAFADGLRAGEPQPLLTPDVDAMWAKVDVLEAAAH